MFILEQNMSESAKIRVVRKSDSLQHSVTIGFLSIELVLEQYIGYINVLF
jgi:hypothetical protein